jgi:hypothetical protein
VNFLLDIVLKLFLVLHVLLVLVALVELVVLVVPVVQALCSCLAGPFLFSILPMPEPEPCVQH